MWTKLAEFTTSRHLHAREYWKATRVRFLKSYSIPRVTKFYRQALTKPQDYGMWKQANAYKFLKAMKMKYFHVCLTMKATLLSLVPKIILARSGGTARCIRKSDDMVFFMLTTALWLIISVREIFYC